LGLQRLQERLAEVEKAFAEALLRANSEQQRSEILHAESASVRAKIEAAKRQLAHEHDELAQDEAAEAARQARANKAFELEEAELRENVEKQLVAATELAITARSDVLRLEQALKTERESSEDLTKTLGQNSSSHDLTQDLCDALQDELDALKSMSEARGIDDELQETQRSVQQIQHQVAHYKSETAFKRQSLQGALDETRRMLQDHLDSIKTAPPDPGLEVLMQALGEAKSRAAEHRSAVARLEIECDSLHAELKESEAVSSLEAARHASNDQQRQHTDLTLELRGAEQALRAASTRADDKAVEAVRAEAKVIDAEKLLQKKEALLRSKLVELWSWIRHIK
jgi:hypothetical protein